MELSKIAVRINQNQNADCCPLSSYTIQNKTIYVKRGQHNILCLLATKEHEPNYLLVFVRSWTVCGADVEVENGLSAYLRVDIST